MIEREVQAEGTLRAAAGQLGIEWASSQLVERVGLVPGPTRQRGWQEVSRPPIENLVSL